MRSSTVPLTSLRSQGGTRSAKIEQASVHQTPPDCYSYVTQILRPLTRALSSMSVVREGLRAVCRVSLG